MLRLSSLCLFPNKTGPREILPCCIASVDTGFVNIHPAFTAHGPRSGGSYSRACMIVARALAWRFQVAHRGRDNDRAEDHSRGYAIIYARHHDHMTLPQANNELLHIHSKIQQVGNRFCSSEIETKERWLDRCVPAERLELAHRENSRKEKEMHVFRRLMADGRHANIKWRS